jgi:hypothetical protein
MSGKFVKEKRFILAHGSRNPRAGTGIAQLLVRVSCCSMHGRNKEKQAGMSRRGACVTEEGEVPAHCATTLSLKN